MVQQVLPEGGRRGLGPTTFGTIAPLKSGVTTVGARSALSHGGRAMEAIVWRERAPRASFQERLAGWRQHLVGWRARNWRRIVLAWFVLSLIVMAVGAEPKTDFPKAQARSVPVVQMVLRVAGGLTVAGVPVLLIVLP
jgi:hypothetical protein